MGVYLRFGVPEFREIQMSHHGWKFTLQLACMYGWEPAGTITEQWYRVYPDGRKEPYGPSPEEWCGSYEYNEYQRVTDEDAKNLAVALERSLPDIPNHDSTYLITRPLEGGGSVGDHARNPLEWWSGMDGKAALREFIALRKQGGCCIA